MAYLVNMNASKKDFYGKRKIFEVQSGERSSPSPHTALENCGF